MEKKRKPTDSHTQWLVGEVDRKTRETLRCGPSYVTYGLADVERVDPEDKTTRPSLESVEEMRAWNIEKKT